MAGHHRGQQNQEMITLWACEASTCLIYKLSCFELGEAETSRHKKKYKQVLYSETALEHSKDSINVEIPWIGFVIFSSESQDSKY